MGGIAGFFLIKYPESEEDNLGTYLDFDERTAYSCGSDGFGSCG